MVKNNEINIKIEKANYPPEVYNYFDFNTLDAFHQKDVMDAMYGPEWHSILITDNSNAFFNIISLNKIFHHDKYDVEPFLGYSGPIVMRNDIEFVKNAVKKYKELCKEYNIVAEIIRFNPLIKNYSFFVDNSGIETFYSKSIVIANCFKDESEQIKQYKAKSARYMINKAKKECVFKELHKENDGTLFIKLYNSALKRVNADSKWFFSSLFFNRVLKNNMFKLYGVYYKNEIQSIALVIEHKLASYYFLAANVENLYPGSNELLIHKICLETAAKDIPSLILGGGNTVSEEDPLLKFKKKFSSHTTPFYMGKIIHNEEIFKQLCSEAIKRNSEIESKNFFLKYRLLC